MPKQVETTEVLAWLQHESAQVTTGILRQLSSQARQELGDLPNWVVVAIHAHALRKAASSLEKLLVMMSASGASAFAGYPEAISPFETLLAETRALVCPAEQPVQRKKRAYTKKRALSKHTQPTVKDESPELANGAPTPQA